MPDLERIDRCVCCGSWKLRPYIDFGQQPLVNNLGNPDKYELAVNVCEDCTHSQLTISVDPKILFSKYLYRSDCQQHREIFAEFSDRCRGKSILDIGCNDGTLLEYFPGWERYGVEPAENFHEICKSKGIRLTTLDTHKKFDVITAFNVVAHVRNPRGLLTSIGKLLKANGKAYILVSQKNMLDKGEFDTIYHEHISYFNITSFHTLCLYSGLYLDNVDVSEMHGGSYLFTLKRVEDKFNAHTEFPKKIQQVGEDFRKKLETVTTPLVGYGASAKGINALNLFKISPEYIVDDNELKQGHSVCGCKIVNSQTLKDDDRDLTIVVLAWNMYDHIVRKIKELRGDRDKFIRIF